MPKYTYNNISRSQYSWNAHLESTDCRRFAQFIPLSYVVDDDDDRKFFFNLTATFIEQYHNLTSVLFKLCDAQPRILSDIDIESSVHTVRYLLGRWRTTRDVKYREWAWRVVQTFQYIFDGDDDYVDDLFDSPTQIVDILATFKYLYLIFSDDDSTLLSSDQWIFTTDHQPLPICGRNNEAYPQC